MKPKVILHNAVSLDGRVTGFSVDLGLYYGLVPRWNEDATLVGSGTILSAPADDSGAGEKPAGETAGTGADRRPLLVVPDSRGRIADWEPLRRTPYWRDVVVLVSKATPRDYVAGLERRGLNVIEAGEGRVDLRAALEELNARFGVSVVRVDSGGTLNGVLLRAGLVDEISVLLHPCLAGEAGPAVFFRDPGPAAAPVGLTLTHRQDMDGGVVWLIYSVVR